MSDRELLERAAKAAGMSYMVTGQYSDFSRNDWARRIPHADGEPWNPLEDDGDALRLAVALGLVVDCSRPSAALPYCRHELDLSEGGNAPAATRRAIVRAAAATLKD